MRRPILLFVLVLLLMPVIGFRMMGHSSWGFYAHKRINRMAVFTLPPGVFGFYKDNIEFVTDHAVDPDKRRYAVTGEAQRHYIDIDHYKIEEEDVFVTVPKKWKDAIKKYTEDTLQAYGIVPWHIEVMMFRLTKAFQEENYDQILKLSADLGHYVGDAHVPLHTTENYNGQLTGQKGIHGFWESRIPELFAEEYDYFVGKAYYIEEPLEFAWQAVKESHHAVDSVLNFEKILSKQFPEDRKYSYETRGNVTVKVYSQEFTKAYSDMMAGMVERRMRKTIIAVGSLWYTAWVNAGKPDLNKHKNKQISPEMQQELQAEDKLHQEGKIKGRGCDHN
ncbi:MAG TPA: zinc dependent phospholipase C family protein [Flavobacteriales bacterium]|nr:zinc dependent phospholipase C family protein [Flavobacteriales bacterium]HRE97659.1 zinc dependent phospholipase C family protein [Flavobacteriales bacterium]HRJ34369.1 zinc dependent phospholipase C family protein [Flavobacteriales bacterium]HRJ39712.1 zinc dependent phospholipase C family protein [Flavobacteriales bacterium]